MNFSFWPFLWFGLPGRLLKREASLAIPSPLWQGDRGLTPEKHSAIAYRDAVKRQRGSKPDEPLSFDLMHMSTSLWFHCTDSIQEITILACNVLQDFYSVKNLVGLVGCCAAQSVRPRNSSVFVLHDLLEADHTPTG